MMYTRFLSIVAVVFIAVATATIMTTQAVSAFSVIVQKSFQFPPGGGNSFQFAKITQNGVTTCLKN